MQGPPLQLAQLGVDPAYDVPAAEGVDLHALALGGQLLGHLPAAPPGAHAQDALGARVEDLVAAVLGGQLGELVAQVLARLLVGVAGHGLGDLGADPAARQQSVPAGAQVPGGGLAGPAGEQPAQGRGDDHAAGVETEEAGERQLEHQEGRQGADGDQDRGADPGAVLALLGAQGLAELEETQPQQQAGQEQHTADQHDQPEPAVALLADVRGGQAVLHHRLRIGAEGLDEGLAVGTEGASLHGPAEGLAEARLEEGDLRWFDRRRVVLAVGGEQLVQLAVLAAVPVRGGGEGVGRRRLSAAPLQRNLCSGPEVESVVRHRCPHRCAFLLI